MRVWMHKKTGDLAIARSIWLEEDYLFEEGSWSAKMLQVGQKAYAFENHHGVIFILPKKVEDEFEDIGEL